MSMCVIIFNPTYVEVMISNMQMAR